MDNHLLQQVGLKELSNTSCATSNMSTNLTNIKKSILNPVRHTKQFSSEEQSKSKTNSETQYFTAHQSENVDEGEISLCSPPNKVQIQQILKNSTFNTHPAKENLQPSDVSYQYKTQRTAIFLSPAKLHPPPLAKSINIRQFEGMETSIAESIRILGRVDTKLIHQSAKESKFESPHTSVNQPDEQDYDEESKTLFSFLHCYPPSTILKIVPNQCTVKALTESDCGKLALVPTEVLLDIKESRALLQALIDSQNQVIQQMQKQLKQSGVIFEKSKLPNMRKFSQEPSQEHYHDQKEKCQIF